MIVLYSVSGRQQEVRLLYRYHGIAHHIVGGAIGGDNDIDAEVEDTSQGGKSTEKRGKPSRMTMSLYDIANFAT